MVESKIYISMTFSVLKKPLHVNCMIELYNLIISPVGWPVKGWKVTVITKSAETLHKKWSFSLSIFFSKRDQIRSFCAVEGADDLPYLDLFHNTDALSIVRIRNKVIFQRPIGKTNNKDSSTSQKLQQKIAMMKDR